MGALPRLERRNWVEFGFTGSFDRLEISERGERLGKAAKRPEGWGLQALQALHPSVLENLPSPLTSHTV